MMTQISPSKTILSPREAALVIFGTDTLSSVRLVRRMLQNGSVKGTLIRNRWYITRTEVERMIDAPASVTDHT